MKINWTTYPLLAVLCILVACFNEAPDTDLIYPHEILSAGDTSQELTSDPTAVVKPLDGPGLGGDFEITLDMLIGTYEGRCFRRSHSLVLVDTVCIFQTTRDTFPFVIDIVSLDSCLLSDGIRTYRRACHIPGFPLQYSNTRNMHDLWRVTVIPEQQHIKISEQRQYGPDTKYMNCYCEKK